MSEHVETRRKIKDIATIKDFNSLLDLIVLTDDERKMMILHYVEGKDFSFIADEIGYAEVTMLKWHRKILSKIRKVLR